METLALFPMPVAHVNIGVHQELVEYLDGISPLQEWHDDVKPVNEKRENNPTFILSDLPSKYIPFRDTIISHMNTFAREVLAYDIKGLQVTQSWINEQKNDIDFHTHTHPNSIVSAVYYYKDTQEPITPIVFWRESKHIAIRYQTISMPIRKDIDSPFAWQHYKFQPSPGTLVMFPSWMIHSVDKNIGSSNRRSLGVNTIPLGGFMDRYISLDHLEYKDYV